MQQPSSVETMFKTAAQVLFECIIPANATAQTLAEDANTPDSLLWQLAWHSDAAVREAVADNPSTNLRTLWLLANDHNLDVRYALAENHNLSEKVLSALCRDDNPYVALRAEKTLRKKNPGYESAELIEQFAAVCHSARALTA